jgi:dTDP-4-dehydrorhamnose 3,5-epimerase
MKITMTPLKKIPDQRGTIFHILRSDEPDFYKFGEAYISTIYPNCIKGWHRHSQMNLTYVCVQGNIMVGIVDEDGTAQRLFIGDDNYCRLIIPSNIWNGFVAVGDKPALVVNIASIPHHPDEIERKNPCFWPHKKHQEVVGDFWHRVKG